MKNSKTLVSLVIVIALVIIDQVLKIWVKTSFFYGEEYRIADWFRLVFIENPGMAFGMEIINKLVLTLFRIVASILFVVYLFRISKVSDVKWGYLICVALITAGTIGNTIDCTFYGVLFDSPVYPDKATFLPPDGGYSALFYGRVVDMFYFPLMQWNWPDWMPVVGGDHFIFFQPVFNVADAALSVGVVVLILFYSRFLSTPLSAKQNKED